MQSAHPPVHGMPSISLRTVLTKVTAVLRPTGLEIPDRTCAQCGSKRLDLGGQIGEFIVGNISLQ